MFIYICGLLQFTDGDWKHYQFLKCKTVIQHSHWLFSTFRNIPNVFSQILLLTPSLTCLWIWTQSPYTYIICIHLLLVWSWIKTGIGLTLFWYPLDLSYKKLDHNEWQYRTSWNAYLLCNSPFSGWSSWNLLPVVRRYKCCVVSSLPNYTNIISVALFCSKNQNIKYPY